MSLYVLEVKQVGGKSSNSKQHTSTWCQQTFEFSFSCGFYVTFLFFLRFYLQSVRDSMLKMVLLQNSPVMWVVDIRWGARFVNEHRTVHYGIYFKNNFDVTLTLFMPFNKILLKLKWINDVFQAQRHQYIFCVSELPNDDATDSIKTRKCVTSIRSSKAFSYRNAIIQYPQHRLSCHKHMQDTEPISSKF